MTEYIANSDFSDTATYGDDAFEHTPATLTDTATYPITPITLPLTIRINGIVGDYYLNGMETTAAQVATTLNGILPGVSAVESGGQVALTTELKGHSASLLVESGGANLTLGFPTTIYVGDDGSFEGTGVDIVTGWMGSATASKQSGSRTGGTGSYVLRCTKTGAPNGLLRTGSILRIGQTYRVTGWAIGDGTSRPSIMQTSYIWSGTTSVDWEQFDFSFIATQEYIDLVARGGGATHYTEFDDVEITPIYSMYYGANNWMRESYQAVGGWADFNQASHGSTISTDDYHDVASHQYAVELFEAGWDNNQRSEYVLGDDIGAAEFSNLVPAYAGAVESFELWDGPPWLDSYDVIAPHEETPPTGWNGWYNVAYASTDVPLDGESFEESWGTDPFQPTGGSFASMWVSGSASPHGVLRGLAIEFPVTIYSTNRVLWILHRYGTKKTLSKLSMTLGDYASASALAAHLNTLLPSTLSTSGFEFESWSDSGETGISFGFNGSTDTSGTNHEVLFCTLSSSPYFQDARSSIGFDSFGNVGRLGIVLYPCSLLSTPLPSGVDSDDTLIVDQWSQILYNTNNTYGAGLLYYGYGVVDATFDSTISGDTNIEQILLTGWFGAGATWQSSLSGASAASFTGPTTIEQFVDTDWPDEVL